jgi:hypothetical protein
MNKRVRAILKTILDDIKANDPVKNMEVITTLNNKVAVDLLCEAGCPESVLEAMKETVYLSSYERTYCCQKISKAIKKIPAG